MGIKTIPGLLVLRPDLVDSVLLVKVIKGSGHNGYGEPAFPNDLMFIFPICILCTIVVCLRLGVLNPISLGDNVDPFVTPNVICPEWYLYPMYVLLRRIYDKIWGLIALISLPIGIVTLPFLEIASIFQNSLRRDYNYEVFIFGLFVILGWGLLV